MGYAQLIVLCRTAVGWIGLGAVESITHIDHSQGRGCGGPGETIPLLALTPMIRLTFFSSHILLSLLFLYHFSTIPALFLYHCSTFSLLARTPVIRLASFHRTFLFRSALSTFFPSRISKAMWEIVACLDWIRLRCEGLAMTTGKDMAWTGKICQGSDLEQDTGTAQVGLKYMPM